MDMRFFSDAEWSFEHDVVMLTCDLSNSNMYMCDGVFTWGRFPTYSALPLFHISLYKYHPLLRKFGNVLIRKILVVTSAYARTDSRGGGGKSQGNPTGSGESHLFLAGNRAVLLGNRRFSWREIA